MKNIKNYKGYKNKDTHPKKNQNMEIQNNAKNIQSKNKINNKEIKINNKESNDNYGEKFNKNKNINNVSSNVNKFEKEIIKKEYLGNKSSNTNNYPLYNYPINSIIKDSKYNIFFILIIEEKNINQSFLSTFSNETGYFSFTSTYINYTFYFINEVKDIKNNEKINYFLVQVPIKNDTKKLTVKFVIERSYNYISFETDIERKNGVANFFFIDNLKYYSYYSYYNNYPTLNNNQIFKFYLNYFFNKKNNDDESIQKSLLKALINKLYYIRNELELEPEIILKFFKYCLYFKLDPRNIKVIKMINQKDNIIKKEYYLTNKDINSFNIPKDEKLKLIYLIVIIYANYNNDYLMELLFCEDGKNYSKVVFNLIIDRKIKYTDLKFKNQENIFQFQKNLLDIAKTKRDINNILKISKGLNNSLTFILNNYKIIYSILDEDKSIYLSDESNFILVLPKINENDNIENIYDSLKNLLNIKNKKDCYIINFEEIFDELVNFYSNKELNELCNLKKILFLFKSNNLKIYNIDKFHKKIHEKGIQLIINNNMNIDEIMDFINKKDIYYYDKKYIKDELREPKIFEYIPITEVDNDYEKNIEILKNNEIWKIYEDSSYKLKEKFYNSFLRQIKKVKQFKYIFDLFSLDHINKDFNKLINKKLDDIFYQVLDENEEEYIYIFKVFKNVLICNEKNGLELKVYILEYNFTSKYFFFLLKNEKNQIIINKIKHIIINFFIDQNKKGKATEESIISLLLLSPNNDFSLKLLNQMDNMILTENDFYQIEENKNFLLFKIFFEKCSDLIKNDEILEGKYLIESLKIKSKISDDLEKSQLKFELIDNLIDENNLFYNKILVIYDNDKQKAQNIYNKIKENLEICKNKLLKFEIIEEYYNTFLENTKKRIITIIKNRLSELKKENLNEILKINDIEIIVDEDFNLETSIKEIENIKYKNSLFFMSIYKEKYNNENYEKTEQEILDESKKDFENAITRIINQKENHFLK